MCKEKKSGMIKGKKELTFHQVMCTVSYKKKFLYFLLSFLFSLKKNVGDFLFLTYKLRIFIDNEKSSCCDADFFLNFLL